MNTLHDDLVEAVQTAINPAVRADLTAELRSVRERIAELSMADPSLRRPPDPGLTVHSYEVAPGTAVPNGIGPADYDEGASRQDPAQQGAMPAGYGHDPAYPPGATDYGRAGPGATPGAGIAGGMAAGYDPYRDQGAPADPRQISMAPRAEQPSGWSSRPWLPLLLAIICGLGLAAFVGFGGVFRDDDPETAAESDSTEVVTEPAGASASTSVVSDIQAVIDGMGYSTVTVEDRDGSVALIGSVGSEAERQAIIGAARALAGSLPFDASGLVVANTGTTAAPVPEASPSSPAAALQRELDRTLASTPIVFDLGQVALTERHQIILTNVVSTLSAYPGQEVTVVGFTDGRGTPEENVQLSQARAQNVKDYLVGQGVPETQVTIRGAGEETSTNLDTFAVLERRVEFEVTGAAAPVAGLLQVGVVAPSDRADLAFTQSMVDALNLVAQERDVEISISDNTPVAEEAAAALASYAEQGYDLIIAHGSQYGGAVQELAPQYPEVVFAFGTASGNFGLPNVYSYDAKAQEGGYVLGAMAGMLTGSGTIGVVGPIEIGDAALYINGFEAGARTQNSAANVRIDYIDSFSDFGLASQSATAHVEAGADVMSGSAQMVVGAVDVADQEGVAWFGTQANQTAMGPDVVVASQVYHWEVVLRSIIDDVAAGRLAGTAYSLTLANAGLVIEYNDAYALAPEIRQRGDELIASISSGAIVPPGS